MSVASDWFAKSPAEKLALVRSVDTSPPDDGGPLNPGTYDVDDAYAAVADALIKAGDVAELAQDVGEGHAALEWAYESAPKDYRNALNLLRLQAKKLAKDAGNWGARNAT